jgi:hypothetical protein
MHGMAQALRPKGQALYLLLPIFFKKGKRVGALAPSEKMLV